MEHTGRPLGAHHGQSKREFFINSSLEISYGLTNQAGPWM